MRLLLVLLLVAAGTAGWVLARDSGERPPGAGGARADPSGEPAKESRPRDAPRRRPSRPMQRSRCPDDVVGCRSVRGRVLYVESVDPDGDGDLHVVLAGGGVTGAGLPSVDVAADLRPRRDPAIGDAVSTAGPVQRGSFGQSQIHALEFHVRRGDPPIPAR